VELRADIHKEDMFDWTPLFIARKNKHLEIGKYLVKHGLK